MYIIIIYIYAYSIYNILESPKHQIFWSLWEKPLWSVFGNMLFLPVMNKKIWSHGKTLIIFDPWQDDDHLSQRLYFSYFFQGPRPSQRLRLRRTISLHPETGFKLKPEKGARYGWRKWFQDCHGIKANRGVYNQGHCNLPVTYLSKNGVFVTTRIIEILSCPLTNMLILFTIESGYSTHDLGSTFFPFYLRKCTNIRSW